MFKCNKFGSFTAKFLGIQVDGEQLVAVNSKALLKLFY